MKRFALLCVVICLLAPGLPAKTRKLSLSGWISDMACARKSVDKAIGTEHAACARKCGANGDTVAFVSEPDHRIYGLDNPFMVRGLEGQRVSLTAEAGATADVLHIVSVQESLTDH